MNRSGAHPAQHLGRVRRAEPPAPENQVGVVEQAKGVLMLRYGIGSYEAFAVLLRWARDAEVDLAVLARTLVHGVCQGRDDPGNSRWLLRWLEQRLRTEVLDEEPAGQPGGTEAVAAGHRPNGRSAEGGVLAGDGGPGSGSAGGTARRRWMYTSAVDAARALRPGSTDPGRH